MFLADLGLQLGVAVLVEVEFLAEDVALQLLGLVEAGDVVYCHAL